MSERDWLDFRGFWPGMPGLEFRVERDDAYIDRTLAPGVLRFIDELEAMVARLTGGNAPTITPAAPPVDLETAPPAF